MSLKHNHTALFEEFKRYALTIQKSFTQSYLNIYLCLLKSLKSNIAKWHCVEILFNGCIKLLYCQYIFFIFFEFFYLTFLFLNRCPKWNLTPLTVFSPNNFCNIQGLWLTSFTSCNKYFSHLKCMPYLFMTGKVNFCYHNFCSEHDTWGLSYLSLGIMTLNNYCIYT